MSIAYTLVGKLQAQQGAGGLRPSRVDWYPYTYEFYFDISYISSEETCI